MGREEARGGVSIPGDAVVRTGGLGRQKSSRAAQLERGDAGYELDEFILERFALTVAAVLARQRPTSGADTASGNTRPHDVCDKRATVASAVGGMDRGGSASRVGLQ